MGLIPGLGRFPQGGHNNSLQYSCLEPCLKVKVKVAQSCPTLWWPHGLYSPWSSPGQNTGLGSLSISLLQGIFPTQELNQVLPHCRWILYQLSHKGSPRILEWVAHPSPAELASFSRHLVLSKKIHGDTWSTPNGPWLFVLSKTTWHGPNVLMYFLDRAQFQLSFSVNWIFYWSGVLWTKRLWIFWARLNVLQSKAIPKLLVIPWMKQAKYTLFSLDFSFFFLLQVTIN